LSRSPYPFTNLGRPSFRKYLADRAIVNAGLWLNRQGPCADFVLFPEADLVVSINANLLFNPFEDFSEQAFHVADLFLRAAGAGYLA
jgi:hypothetical protein